MKILNIFKNNFNNSYIDKNKIHDMFEIDKIKLVMIGMLLKEFSNNEISYDEFKIELHVLGFNICDIIFNNDSDATKSDFVFNDINSYIVSDKDDNKYSIYLNNKLIELLAIYGDHESYSNFKTILDFNLRQGNKKLFKGWKVRNGMWTHKKVK